jgi:acetyl esterase/lipase
MTMKKFILLSFCIILFFAFINISNAQHTKYPNLDYVGNGNSKQFLDLYVPTGLTQPAPLIIYIHGGGWSGGAKGGALDFCDTLLKNGYVVADINYRLSGDSIFPAQIYDCKAAVRWLKSNALLYNIDTCRVAVTGSSAGGHLASLLGTSGGVDSLENFALGSTNTTSKVHAVIPFYGPSDFMQMQSHIPLTPPDSCTNPMDHLAPTSPESKLLGCSGILTCPDKVKKANPITYIDSNDPPFKLFHGSFDCSVPVYQSIILDSTLTSFGVYSLLVILPHVGHAFRPDSLQKLDMLNFLNSKLLPCGQTGIESGNFNSKDFIIYPNPATENVHLQTNNENIKSIKIFNVHGQLIREYFTNDFSVSNLPDGIYFVTVQTDNSIYTNKLIKE